MALGIDTASVAGNKVIDWTKAKANGIGYAIHRAAYGTSEDTVYNKKTGAVVMGFAKEWPAMKKAGVVRGAYLFLRFPCKSRGKLVVPTPTAQAEAICKIVGVLDPCDFPIFLDVEFPGEGQPDTGMTPAQLLKGVLEAWQVLKDHYGVAPIIYTSARVWLDDLKNPAVPAAVKESLLWLARYAFAEGQAILQADAVANPPVPPPWAGTDPTPIRYRGMPYSVSNWLCHQYMGNATGCPGFPTGNVDMNRIRPLAKGDSGERVKWVQRRLGFKGKNVDGKFGPMTDKAVRVLQETKNDVVADGIVGPRTFAYLCWMNP